MRFLVVLSLVLIPAAVAAGSHWERFRGPNGSGIAADKNVPVTFSDKENVLWKTPIPGVGNASPVVWDQHVFVHTASEDGKSRSLLCLNAADGKVRWARTIPGVKVKVRYDSSLASSTPATDGEAVYVTYWDGNGIVAYAYDYQGKELWKHNLGQFVSQHGAGASPVVYKDKLLFFNDMDKEDPKTKSEVTNPSLLVALDKKTGAVAWEAPREANRACYSALFFRPSKEGTPELVVVSTPAIAGYNPDTGTKNWEVVGWQSKTVRMPLRTVAAAILVGDTLIASSGDGAGDRFAAGLELHGSGTATTAKRLWENFKDFPYVPCPLARGEYVYFVNDNGFAGCYDAATGKRVWQERQPDAKFTASPVLIDGKVYAPSDQGDVFVFAAEPSFKLLARNPLGERVRATPAVADNRLYVRGDKHLFCIGKK